MDVIAGNTKARPYPDRNPEDIDLKPAEPIPENLPKGVEVIQGKHGNTYHYKGKIYNNLEDIRTFLGQPLRTSETVNKAGEWIGEQVGKSSIATGFAGALGKLGELTSLPGEEAFAQAAGDSAQKWGLPHWAGSSLAYLMYPGLGELKMAKGIKPIRPLARINQQLAPVGVTSDVIRASEDISFTNKPLQTSGYTPGTGPLDAPVRSKNRTRAQRSSGPNQLLRDAGNTPEGIRRHQEALDYRLKHGNLTGYKDTTTPWILPNGEEIIFRKTETGVKKSLKSDRASAQLQRSTNELIQTHGKQDWNELFPGFTDPKKLPLEKIEGHHAHMVEGYTWAFDGVKPAEAKKITKHFYDKGTPLGKTQFNRNNLPHPVHKALHSWMDKQLGLNGLDMPSLKGMDAKTRIAHLEVYLEHVQPVVDEATFSLMKRYQQLGDTVDWTKPGSYKKLMLEGVSPADQFIDKNR
jgi:hypothetical protein